jgi:hypothetical protein
MSSEDKIRIMEEMITNEMSSVEIFRPGAYRPELPGDSENHRKHKRQLEVLLEAREALATVETFKGVLSL